MCRKTIVILANSIKHGQHCVAGKCILTNQWIRPVSNETGAELNHDQVKYQNPYGSFSVKPLQKISMGLSRHAPLLNQPENHIIDDSVWTQNYSITDAELPQFIDNPDDLWGLNDRVDYSDIESGLVEITQSLYLVTVTNLSLYKNIYDKRRASFNYNGNSYDLAVTSPNFHIHEGNNYESKIICVSLGEVFEGSCFKLVANIF